MILLNGVCIRGVLLYLSAHELESAIIVTFHVDSSCPQ